MRIKCIQHLLTDSCVVVKAERSADILIGTNDDDFAVTFGDIERFMGSPVSFMVARRVAEGPVVC